MSWQDDGYDRERENREFFRTQWPEDDGETLPEWYERMDNPITELAARMLAGSEKKMRAMAEKVKP